MNRIMNRSMIRGMVLRAATGLAAALGVAAAPLQAQLSYTNTTFLNGFASDSCKYAGYATIVLSPQARKCGYGIKVLERLDDRWALYVNGTTSTSILNDGIVPNNRSVYPVSTNLLYNAGVSLVDHLNIYKTQNGLRAVGQGMLRIGMKSTAPPPPPPGFTASISGPSTVNLCGGSWFGAGANGVAPYSYVWTVGGQTFNTGGSNGLDYSPSTYGSMTISLTVRDAQAHTATTSKPVTVSQGGMC